MADYTEFVKVLRTCAERDSCVGLDDCPYLGTGMCDNKTERAADAMAELQQTVEHYKGCSNDWYREACDYKAMLPRWIPVTERLPEPYTNVLLYGGEELYTGYMHSDKRFTVNASHFPDRPTHWMPLPAPPKEEKEGGKK